MRIHVCTYTPVCRHQSISCWQTRSGKCARQKSKSSQRLRMLPVSTQYYSTVGRHRLPRNVDGPVAVAKARRWAQNIFWWFRLHKIKNPIIQCIDGDRWTEDESELFSSSVFLACTKKRQVFIDELRYSAGLPTLHTSTHIHVIWADTTGTETYFI